MNYTLNRALADGAASLRIQRAHELAPKLTDFDAWSSVWLDEAKRAEGEEQWIDAARYYHNAEFYLPAGGFATASTTTSSALELPRVVWRIALLRRRSRGALR